MELSSPEIKFLFENYKFPLLFNGILDWSLLKWDLETWGRILKEETLQFRKGLRKPTEVPQWERSTPILTGTFQECLEFARTNKEEWLYFDYKYLNEHLIKHDVIQSEITWKKFGYPEATAKDSTIWIGTAGAHTSCHADTYGYNLVAQIYGRKLWILFPPDENLLPSRVPYEESSIYSKINFYCPNIEECKALTNCISIILEPGQVLFVPNGWWHYVENLDIAITINTWIPSKSDDDKRLDEIITQIIVKSISTNLNKTDKDVILNPNESREFPIYESLMTLQECVNKNINNYKFSNKKVMSKKERNNFDVTEILDKCSDNVKVLKKLSREEYITLLSNQFKRFNENDNNIEIIQNKKDLNKTHLDIQSMINIFTDTDVISLIKEKLMKTNYHY